MYYEEQKNVLAEGTMPGVLRKAKNNQPNCNKVTKVTKGED